MGEDIYMYAERRCEGQWRLLGLLIQNPGYSPGEDPLSQPYKPVGIYTTRRYELFDILANVRHLRDHPYESIANLRGLPDGASPEIVVWRSGFGDYAHNASWLTLCELLAFDWYGKTHQLECWVDERIAHLFAPDRPFPHCPPGMSVDEFNSCLVYTGANQHQYTNVRWMGTYAEAAGPEFMQEVLDKLQEAGDPDDVRIVFWFAF